MEGINEEDLLADYLAAEMGEADAGQAAGPAAPTVPEAEMPTPPAPESPMRKEIRRILAAPTPWDTLEVSRDASRVACEKAYRKLCVLVHPDKAPYPEAADATAALGLAMDWARDPAAWEAQRRDREQREERAAFWSKHTASGDFLRWHQLQEAEDRLYLLQEEDLQWKKGMGHNAWAEITLGPKVWHACISLYRVQEDMARARVANAEARARAWFTAWKGEAHVVREGSDV